MRTQTRKCGRKPADADAKRTQICALASAVNQLIGSVLFGVLGVADDADAKKRTMGKA